MIGETAKNNRPRLCIAGAYCVPQPRKCFSFIFIHNIFVVVFV